MCCLIKSNRIKPEIYIIKVTLPKLPWIEEEPTVKTDSPIITTTPAQTQSHVVSFSVKCQR